MCLLNGSVQGNLPSTVDFGNIEDVNYEYTVVTDDEDNLLYSAYGSNEGNPLNMVMKELKALGIVKPELSVIFLLAAVLLTERKLKWKLKWAIKFFARNTRVANLRLTAKKLPFCAKAIFWLSLNNI